MKKNKNTNDKFKKYIQILKVDILLGNIKVTDDTVYVDAFIYAKLRKKIDESTIDSIIHEITGKEYASYIEPQNDDDAKKYTWNSQKYTWNHEKKLYSRRA